jgi:hypothetical protein
MHVNRYTHIYLYIYIYIYIHISHIKGSHTNLYIYIYTQVNECDMHVNIYTDIHI